MITSSELSLFSKKGQKKLLKKHGELLAEFKSTEDSIVEIYEFENNYFHVISKQNIIKEILILNDFYIPN